MIRKILFSISFLVLFCFFSTSAFADNEFLTNTNITYDIDNTGITTVTEAIKIKNLTDKYFASSFTLMISTTDISDVSASDANGPLVAKTQKEGNKSKITIDFNEQNAGKGKEYNFNLVFHSKDFAIKQGKVWQVSVPKITPSNSDENYNLVVKVPLEFGQPTSISPKPQRIAQENGKLLLSFTQQQLEQSGILASFGDYQLFSFNLKYHISNDELFPANYTIALPADTQYQQVEIDSISPRPKNVTVDNDGNYIAVFTLDRKSSVDIVVSGIAKLTIDPKNTLTLLKDDQDRLTTAQKYWEKDNPAIKAKLDELVKGHENDSNNQKAKLIYNFVVNHLQYDETRLQNNDFERLGGLVALNNPQRAMCSEFSDLFITLARAANIPTRHLIGYAYTSNKDTHPLSYDKNVLHAWPEYYDPQVGWVMVDPTWENTTGGIDYFTKTDMNHFVFVTQSNPSEQLDLPDDISVSFTDKNITKKPEVRLSIVSPSTIFSAFPSQITTIVNNASTLAYPSSQFALSAKKLGIVGEKLFNTPVIPPFGYVEYKFDTRVATLFDSYSDRLSLVVADQALTKSVQVKPFYANKYFAFGVVFIVLAMLGFYFGIIYWQSRNPKTLKYRIPEPDSTK